MQRYCWNMEQMLMKSFRCMFKLKKTAIRLFQGRHYTSL